MKRNEQLLEDSYVDIHDLSESDIFHLMKEAQVEAIKELIKRKWDNTNNMFMGGTGTKCKSVDEIALELIKEIES